MILDTSAWVGSLIIPANSLESHLGRYASQLAVWTHDDVYKLSIPGSATGLFFDGRAMLVCTMHQLKEFELSDVGLMLPDGSYLVTSSGSRTFRPGDYTKTTDAYDLVAFDFSKPEAEIPSLTRAFFPFEKVPPDTPNSNIVAYIIAGYPSADQKYEIVENNHLGMVRRVVIAEPDGQSADPALLKLKFLRELEFNPDGLSGSPAFVVQRIRNEYRVFLSGIVVRAGRTHCYILKSGFLWEFLSSFE